MSEPYGAFMKVRIGRPALVRWLDAAPPSASRWTDWRDMGGRWYLKSGPADLRDAPAADLAAIVAEVDARLSAFISTRDVLKAMLRPDPPDTDESLTLTRRIAYEATARELVAGALLYGEGLSELMLFLTIARGCTPYLPSDEHGLAVIHDWIFGPQDDTITMAALTLGPGDRSRFLAATERNSATGAFRGLADTIMEFRDRPPAPIDQLDELR